MVACRLNKHKSYKQGLYIRLYFTGALTGQLYEFKLIVMSNCLAGPRRGRQAGIEKGKLGSFKKAAHISHFFGRRRNIFGAPPRWLAGC